MSKPTPQTPQHDAGASDKPGLVQPAGSAFLCVDSYAGRRETLVEVIGPYADRRPDRTVIRALTETRVPSGRVLQPGHKTTVPTWALRMTPNDPSRSLK